MRAEHELVDLDQSPDEYEEGCEYDPDVLAQCQHVRFKARRLVVQEFLNIQDERRKLFLGNYEDELRPLDRWPRKWMANNKQIRSNLDQKKNTLFVPVMNYLCKRHYDSKKSQRVTTKINSGGYDVNGTIRDYVILRRLDTKRVADDLGTSRVTVHRYLKEMVHWGILKDLGKYGPNSPRVLAIGYFQPFDVGLVKPIWFLKNSKKMKQALREFDTMRRV